MAALVAGGVAGREGGCKSYLLLVGVVLWTFPAVGGGVWSYLPANYLG